MSMKAGTKAVHWTNDETNRHAIRVAEMLLDKGFPADGWEPPMHTQATGHKEIFDAAQRELIEPERWKGGRKTGRGFRAVWGKHFGVVRVAIKNVDRARAKEREAQRVIESNHLPPTPAPKQETPAPETDPDKMDKAQLLDVASKFVAACPTGLLIEAVLDRLLPHRGERGPENIQVNVTADVRAILDSLQKGQDVLLADMAQFSDKVRVLEQRFNDFSANVTRDYMDRPKLVKITVLGAHKQEFVKLSGLLSTLNLPVQLLWRDSNTRPEPLFTDYVIAQASISHSWNDHCRNSVAPNRYIMIGQVNAERMKDQILLWLKK